MSPFRQGGVVVAAAVAVVAALPSLRLPFLSDDWAHLASVSEGAFLDTAFGYFRPLTAATYGIEWALWGLSPLPYHLTGVVLAAVAAALVVILTRRYTGDTGLAGTAGFLFALHPYHVENVSWIAGRADLLAGVLVLAAALAYDRWRDGARGVPLAALFWFEAALLAKESAIVLPGALLVLGAFQKARRPDAAEWVRGYLPLAAVALAHFLIVRAGALGGVSLGPLGYLTGAWRNLPAFGVSAILPLHTETIEASPVVWGTIALVAVAVLLSAARVQSGRVPVVIWPAAAVFVVLLGPSLISFQERYAFLPVAASALALAGLLASIGRVARVATLSLIVLVWGYSIVEHWRGWNAAGRASERLFADLVKASEPPDVREIVVANMPHRVRGAPVAADFPAAVRLSGGRDVAIRPATFVDYPSDLVDGRPVLSRSGDVLEVALEVEPGRYARLVRPRRPAGSDRTDEDWGEVVFEGDTRLLVRIFPEAGRSVHVWRTPLDRGSGPD